MKDNNNPSRSAGTERKGQKSKLIDDLLKQGKITLNESRILLSLAPIKDSQYDKLIKKE